MSDHIIRTKMVPATLNIVDVTFGKTVWKSLEMNSANMALVEVGTGQTITFGELMRRAELVARRLLHQGCGGGDIIAIFAPNSIAWMVFFLAVWRIGAIPAPINSMLTPGELLHQLRVCGAKYIFTAASLVDQVFKAGESIKIQKIFLSSSAHPDCVDIESGVTEDQLPRLPSLDALSVHPSDPAVVFFSSGTTGLHKGVLLSHRNLQATFHTYLHQNVRFKERVSVTFGPFSHLTGCMMTLLALADGITVHLLLHFDLDDLLRTLEENKIRSVFLPATLVTLLIKFSGYSKYKPMLEDVIVGTAPLNADLENQLKVVYPGVKVRQMYGLTETMGMTTGVPNNPTDPRYKHAPGSVGVPTPDTLVKVIDPKTGRSLGPRAKGEVCAKTPLAMMGYISNPQATAETIDSEEWLHTGDMGYYDEDGNIFIVDRLKELIKYKGYQVPPAELEAVLLSHPEVADAAVVGLPDSTAGELPLAWVVKKPDATVTDSQLRQFVDDKVAPYMRLRGGVQFVDAIPKSPSGKILRREIRAALQKSKL